MNLIVVRMRSSKSYLRDQCDQQQNRQLFYFRSSIVIENLGTLEINRNCYLYVIPSNKRDSVHQNTFYNQTMKSPICEFPQNKSACLGNTSSSKYRTWQFKPQFIFSVATIVPKLSILPISMVLKSALKGQFIAHSNAEQSIVVSDTQNVHFRYNLDYIGMKLSVVRSISQKESGC